ncbi:hypothetical protein LOTGIDRAFT_175014 [Lottia gigantea]|uniref:Uncharacterized protein n=1 Tax=Lottia gigantea TaxID=225164 RepID=V3ZWR6_LOTGI|nr:hypothetical protein LOTGIDRAFT_175014 [Lottia gigantea]ESO95958.1 hypothetical protein LOTGIDRAFT_175014 [Lottia gigantea]
MASFGHNFQITLSLPGILRIGDANPKYIPSPFKGYITAVALYNTDIDIGNIPQLLNNAKKSNWQNIPTFPPCPNRVQNNVAIKHLWPLDEKGLTIDINTNNVDEDSQCLRFGHNHTSLPNRAIHIDGSPLSYITLKINGSEIDETFTLTVNVFITSESSGSFLKIINNLDQTLFQMDISETNVELKAFNGPNANCATVTLSDIFTTNTWYVVGIHRDVNANTIGVMIDGNINDTSDTCGTFGSSGELSVLIGDSNRQLVGYRTDVRCLIMFSDPGSDIMTAIKDECTDADSTLVGE